MTPEPRYPERVPRRYAGRTRTARETRAYRARRYSTRGSLQSTKALTVKLAVLAIVPTLAIGGLIAAQMASGQDPALGPKATKHAKNTTAKSSNSGSSAGSASSGSSASDPYSQVYGDDGYYSSGSSGYSSGSGYSTQQSAPAPVTSSTS
ncbi:MAG: hypothetical protein WB771_13835 [Solirubrobacterales bacterium]